MAKKRSDKYDFFQGVTSNPLLEKKAKRKNIWKWTKRVIFFFLGIVTLTGLIQTFIWPTSTSVGSATEFAQNENGVVPNVASFEAANSTINGKSQKTGFTYNVKNQLVLNPTQVDIIKKQINSQDKSELYGTFNTRTSAVRIISNESQNLSSDIYQNQNGQYLVKNTGQDTLNSYSSIYDSYETIPFYITDTTKANGNLSAFNSNISLSLQEVNIQNSDGTISKGYSLNNNAIKKEINKDTFSNQSLDATQQENLKFSLDVLQSLYLQTLNLDVYKDSSNFSNNIAGFTQVPSNISFKEWINSLKAGAILNEKQRDLLIAYNLAIASYLNITNFRQEANSTEIDSVVFDKNLSQAISTTVNSNGASTALPSAANQSTFSNWGEAWAQGPWFGLFVYPISVISLGILNLFPDPTGVAISGGNVELTSFGIIIAIFIIVFLIRFISFLITSRSVFAQVKMQELNPKKAKIDAKYAPFKGNKEMQRRKAQETQQLYKKNNIRVSSQFVSILITMPIFFAMFKIIQGIPSIKVTTFLGVNFASTSWQELFAGNFSYLPILIVVFFVQLISQFIPRFLTKRRTKERTNVLERQALKKANRTQNIVAFVFAFFGLILTAGVQIYWIAGGLFTILQSLFVHYFQNTRIYREKLKKYV